MDKPKFVYLTYIRTTPEKLWQALTDPAFTKRYFCACEHVSEWKPGASWKIEGPDGLVTDSGHVIEVDPPKKLVLAWKNEFRPELAQEGVSRMTYAIEPMADMVKLTVTHEGEKPGVGTKLIEAVSNGWPMILASLKSFLETGEALEATTKWKGSCEK